MSIAGLTRGIGATGELVVGLGDGTEDTFADGDSDGTPLIDG